MFRITPMGVEGIFRYTLRAAAFAAGVTALFGAVRLGKNRGVQRWKSEILLLAAVFYLAALVEITALRGGARPGAHPIICYLPMQTTIEQAKAGAWPFAYHTLGNLLWFVPLGIFPTLLWPAKFDRAWKLLLLGGAISAAIEFGQWLLNTGVPDIDDVWLNALGAFAGAGICRFAARGRKK